MFHCIASKFGLNRTIYYGTLVGDVINLTHIAHVHVSNIPRHAAGVPCDSTHHTGNCLAIPAGAEELHTLGGRVKLHYREADFYYTLGPGFLTYYPMEFSPLVATSGIELDVRFKRELSQRYVALKDSIHELFDLGGITTITVGDAAFHKGNDPKLTLTVSGELVEAITGKYHYTSGD